MNQTTLAFGFLEYVVFLFSTTCHEAAHAAVAKWGGDTTAFEGGQVSLNPVPHIRREPFGMVVLPLMGIVMGFGLIGYASAPYNPVWSVNFPRRSALMSLAGPAANFGLAVIAGILMSVGLATGFFAPGGFVSMAHIVDPASEGLATGIAAILSVFFSLNLLLGCFNLIPVPPLDGYGALSLFAGARGAARLLAFRYKLQGFGVMIAMLLASRVIDYIYSPLLLVGVRLIYLLHHFR